MHTAEGLDASSARLLECDAYVPEIAGAIDRIRVLNDFLGILRSASKLENDKRRSNSGAPHLLRRDAPTPHKEYCRSRRGRPQKPPLRLEVHV